MIQAHPTLGKQKSVDICDAFLRGAPKDVHGHVFYGVNETNLEAWRWVRACGEPFWYIDNSYFDHTRKTHFRVTKNALQCQWTLPNDGARWRAIEVPLKPWNCVWTGLIVVCPQSDNFMHNVARYHGNWLADTLKLIEERVDGKVPVIKVRPWSRDKKALSATLVGDLVGADWLFTHSSAASVAATIHGVPIHVDPKAALFGLRPNDKEREHAMGTLADNQWTLEEIRAGMAWEKLR